MHRAKALILIEVTEEGIVICSNVEHPSKALLPIHLIEEGIFIPFNDEHPLNV